MMDYQFAVNKIKLQQAITAIKNRNILNPLTPIEINEETVKEEYVKRAGLLLENASKEVQEAVEEKEIEEEVKKIVKERKANKKK